MGASGLKWRIEHTDIVLLPPGSSQHRLKGIFLKKNPYHRNDRRDQSDKILEAIEQIVVTHLVVETAMEKVHSQYSSYHRNQKPQEQAAANTGEEGKRQKSGLWKSFDSR